jgi:hypothetical protein
MSDPVIVEIEVAAPVDAVWRAGIAPSCGLVIRTRERVIVSRYA